MYKYIIYFKPNDCGCDSQIKIQEEHIGEVEKRIEDAFPSSILKDRNISIKKLSLTDNEFYSVISKIWDQPKSGGYTLPEIRLFEYIIKVLRYMDKGIYFKIFNFDNLDGMKNSLSILADKMVNLTWFSGTRYKLFDPSLYEIYKNGTHKGEKGISDFKRFKELLAIIDRIPEMDIFN